MKKIAYLYLFCGLLASVGCELVEECSGTVSSVYTVPTDVSVDFSANEVPATAEVLTSDCESLPVGTTKNDTVPTLTRTDSQLLFVIDSEESVSATIEGSSLAEFSRTQSFPGCEVTVVLTGQLDPETNTITASGSFVAQGLTCNADL